tara:strand:- start:54 stop:911 length:858 start_codon:yes stop_codon:yes gene_type:complete
MGWFSDVFSLETLVPIAAGIALPGIGGVLAGSALSGAMAASKGEDFLGGAITGGLGAYTGQSLGSAFNPGALASTGGKAIAGAPPLPAFTGQAGAIGDAVAAGNYSGALSQVGTGLAQGVQNLGGGSSLVGAGKLASTGLGIAGMATMGQPPMTMEEDDRGKYDPNATLNLSGDTGLRLIASGGYIGKYANGGYLEGGPAEGDGMSDDIPATIDETQPAALSEGEFVIPADVVAFAGNGSSDAGARRFYEMMEQIRRDATGRPEQIREIDVEDYMPMSDGIGALA